jgi:tRNA(adenine34) deaminase
MITEKYIIEKCKTLAAKAKDNGNPAVGCIIAVEDKIIALAEEGSKSDGDITAHAEIKALKLAVKSLQSNDLSRCTLYTTHEPCVMCSYAIRFHRISKVVYLYKVDYLGGISSSFPILTTGEVPTHWAIPPKIIHYRED